MTAARSVDDVLETARGSSETFLQLTAARARRDAQNARSVAGPLAGLPFAVKDVFDVAGTRTSGASQLFDRRPHARTDAEAVRRLTRAGGVCIGKTTLSELAYSGLGVNDRFGTPTIDREGMRFVVGGSSSGSAAAVRAGVVPFALASDTSGSARIPAAWCGIHGFRPSLGRYPTNGMQPLSPTLDTVGVVAADVVTLIDVDAVLAAQRSGPGGFGPTRFLIPHDEYLDRCAPSLLEGFHVTVERMRAAGFAVGQQRMTALEEGRALHEQHVAIVEEEALAAYGAWSSQHPEAFTPAVERRLHRARSRLQVQSAEPLRRAATALRARFARELGDAILLSPPSEIDAPALDDVHASPEAEDSLNARALRLTMLLSYLDAPSAVIPVGTRDGVPVPASLQLSGSTGSDRRVLAAAERLGSRLS